jgi:predicted TIM-barrel fold metal-dependent hydrolase
MLIDFHTHIFPKAVREHRERYLAGEPAFELLYASEKSKMVGADELVAAMDAQGVDKAVTFGFPWQSMQTARRHNDYVLEAVARHPDRLIGFCCVDAAQPEAPAEVARCLEAGLSGVGELAFYCDDFACRLDEMDQIMALARRFDCPVMIHTNEPVGHHYPGKTNNTLAQIYALVKRYSHNRIVLAHWGGGIFWYTLMKKEVSETLAHVWFDTAASPYLYKPDIYRLAATLAGCDKILFGTDYPLLAASRYLKEMDQAGLDEAQKAQICFGNAAALLKLNPLNS